MEKKYFNIRCTFLFFMLGYAVSLQAMHYENRYLPLLQKLLVKKPEASGQLMINPFIWTGEQSFWEDFGSEEPGGFSAEGEIPLFNINGMYNQLTLNNALLYSGQVCQNSFRSDFINTINSLNWAMDGIIRGQGIGLTFYQPWNRYISWGFNFFFARLTSALQFKPNRVDFNNFSPGDFIEIEATNNGLQDCLCLSAREYSVTGMSDFELYMRLGVVEDYNYRMRHFDLGANFGVIMPSAQQVNYFNPAAIPLGGNGHWGFFASVDGQFELKENLGVGLLLRLNKFFSRSCNRRMVQLTEPNNYGVIFGPSKVEPGVSVIFSPYAQLLRLRSGFGLQAQYTLVYHQEDNWKDLRKLAPGQPPANIELMEKRSQWASEYVNVGVMYDFSKDSKERFFKPIVTFVVDVPVQFLVAKRVAKTFGISLTVESTLW